MEGAPGDIAPPLPASLKPTTIHHELLRGARSAIVRSQEEDHLRKLLRQDAALEGLIPYGARRGTLEISAPQMRLKNLPAEQPKARVRPVK